MSHRATHDYTVGVDNEYFTEDTYPAGRTEYVRSSVVCMSSVEALCTHVQSMKAPKLITFASQSPTLDSTLFTGSVPHSVKQRAAIL